MLKNYIKVAWRNLLHNKIYSAINILGLAVGLAVTLIIGLWVHKEYSFDKFLPENDRLFQVVRHFNSNGDTLTFKTVSLRLADELRSSVPEIEYVAESDWMGEHGLTVGETKVFLRGGMIGGDFLKMFQYELLKGNRGTALNDPYSIVLTESTAKTLFGEEDAMNKTVRIDNAHDLKVTGILKDLPATSTLTFKYIVPFSFAEATDDWVKRNRTGGYSQNANQIFVKLKAGVDINRVNSRIRLIEHTEKGSVNAMNSYVHLQPVTNWHLYDNFVNGKETGGFLEYVRLFTIVGVLVLMIACINFVNLSTARSEKRAREVGIRKAIGSERKQLIFQFLVESFVMTFFAFLVSLIIAQFALPAFNALTGGDLVLPFTSVTFWLLILSGLIITSLLAGSRPAFYLSSFKPVKVLKGLVVAGKPAAGARKALVILQFSCSVSLIISTIVIYQQVEYGKNRPKGLDADRLIGSLVNDELDKNYVGLKNELIQKRIITDMTMASSPATDVYWHSDMENFPGKRPGETVEMGVIIVADDYFKTLGMTLREGRTFSNENDTFSVVMNKAAVERLRLKDPITQKVNFQGTEYQVIGVVNDAVMTSPYAPADPTVFFTSSDKKGNLMYRIAPGVGSQKAIGELTAAFNKYNPSFPFTYNFVDDTFAQKFRLELLTGKLSAVFATLAIFISCLGLFGLIAYVAERRTKEIGIRKVLGASVAQVWLLLTKEFILLVMISCAIAIPVAFYFVNGWLEKYPYRVSLSAGIFIAASLLAMLLTVLTISVQALRAGLANPVRSLRSE